MRQVVGRGVVPAVVLVVALGGCAEPAPGTVTGKVTIKGIAPKAANVAVSVLASSGRSFSAPLRPDGSFIVPDVPPGPVQLAVSAVDPEPQTGEQAPSASIEQKFAVRPVRRPPPKQPFASRYTDPRTSGFSAVVEPGKTVIADIDVP